jgi:antitoxin component YwqK of YwqJK toxin-antitoxin module
MNFLYPFLVLSGIVLFAACTGDTKRVKKDEEGRVVAEWQVRPGTEIKQGPYKRFNENGMLIEKAQYKNDSLEGTREIYHPNGKIFIVESYAKGSFQGPYSSYFENGNLESEGEYRGGSMEGVWNFYYPSGSIKERVTFTSNEENGPFEEFFENGNIKARGNYKDGDYEHGLLELFDSTGTLIRKMDCDIGRCRTIWSIDESE